MPTFDQFACVDPRIPRLQQKANTRRLESKDLYVRKTNSLAVGVDAAGVLTPGAHLPPVLPLGEVGDGELPRVLRGPVLERGHAVGLHVLVGLLSPLVVEPAHVETPSGDGLVVLPGAMNERGRRRRAKKWNGGVVKRENGIGRRGRDDMLVVLVGRK